MTLYVAAITACLLAPNLAEAYGRSGPPSESPFLWAANPGVAAPQWSGSGRRTFSETARWGRRAAWTRRSYGWRGVVTSPATSRWARRAAPARRWYGWEQRRNVVVVEGSRWSVPASPSPQWSTPGGDVVAEAARWIGSGKFTAPPGPWCADAVSAWLQRTGHRPLENRMASAALAYGPQLPGPQVGALVVLGSRRGWASHVGIVSGVEPDGSIRLISGNWGRRVAEAVVARRAVAAFVAVQ